MDKEVLFTPAAILDFLLQIDELADKEIVMNEDSSGLSVKIGESTYNINFSDAQEIEVPEEVVDEVGDINEATYNEIDSTDYIQTPDIPDDAPIEAGIISELLKTLAVGGMVRLAGKIVGKDALGK